MAVLFQTHSSREEHATSGLKFAEMGPPRAQPAGTDLAVDEPVPHTHAEKRQCISSSKRSPLA